MQASRAPSERNLCHLWEKKVSWEIEENTIICVICGKKLNEEDSQGGGFYTLMVVFFSSLRIDYTFSVIKFGNKLYFV